MISFNPLGGQIASNAGGGKGDGVGIGVTDSGAVGGGAVIGGDARSSSSQIAITGGGGSSSSLGGSSSSIMTTKRGSSSSSSSGRSSSSNGDISNSSKIISIKGKSGGSRHIHLKGGTLISIGKKIIYGGKSKGFSRQGDVETMTVARDEEEPAKENVFSDGLLGKLIESNYV